MNKKELYNKIMESIAIQVKKALNEGSSNNFWRNVPNTAYVYHGEWSDPEVKVFCEEGTYIINIYDLERFIAEETDMTDVYGFDADSFDDWMDKQTPEFFERILDEYIGASELEPINENLE